MPSLADQLDLKRMTDDLWELVSIPSPTGRERNAALAFAAMLKRAGAKVEVDETIPESPAVIGRLAGHKPGKTFQLAGHLDHIDVPHPPPARQGNIVSGRGAADMKNGLAAMLEVVRVLARNPRAFPGELLVTAYGLHEAPNGNSASILDLIRKGVMGDAALVAETGHAAEGAIVLQGKGQSIWNLTIRRDAGACHELNYPPDAPSFFDVCLGVARTLTAHGLALSARPCAYELLSPESLFVGQMHYGDFYNRVPSVCTLQGTRRWLPDKDFAAVRGEMDRLLAALALPAGTSVSCGWIYVGESYAVDRKEAVVRAQQRAHQEVYGQAPALMGLSVVTDANRLAPTGKVPTVLCGFDNEFAHADFEYVRLDRLLAPAKTTLLTVLNYLQENA